MQRFGYLHSTSFVPSMFVRRLVLLASLAAAVVVVLVLQTCRLTIVESERWLEVADSRLTTERYIPTTRGRIVDRQGRVLAEDRPAFDVLVEYEVITGQWAARMAERAARRAAGAEWAKLSPTARAALIDEHLPEFETEQELMWHNLSQVLGVERAELDARRDAIRQRVQRMANHLWSMWLEERQEALLSSGSERGAELAEELEIADVARPIREQTEPHVIASGVTESQAAAVRRLAERSPGLHLDAGTRRAYPLGAVRVAVDRSTFPEPMRPSEGEEPVVEVDVTGAMTHIVGRMRALNRVAEGEPLDTDRRPRIDPATGEIDLGHYRDGDAVGGSGVEGTREDVLRGLRGMERTRLDTGVTTETPPRAGRDVRLTVDAHLQARVLAVLRPEFGFTVKQPWHKSTTVQDVRQADGSFVSEAVPMGTELNAAVVVLDIETSDVLALATWPTYTREQLQEDPSSVFGDPLRAPWVNRAISKPFAPGSIVKPLVFCAAVTEGEHRVNETIECGGYLFEGRPQHFRDWIFKQYRMTFSDIFGRGLYGDEAIGVSSNIFFYTLGMRLGVERLVEWYKKFGVGEPIDLGVDGVLSGMVGPRDGKGIRSDAILMGIGQGPIAWTPLHAADAYATIARMGVRILPRIDRDAEVRVEHLNLDARAVDMALEGLRYATQETQETGAAFPGTGHHFTIEGYGQHVVFQVPGVSVLGKTGTATANALVHDPDGPEGPEPARVLRDGDHAWFVGLVGPEGQPPRYVISVLVEYAGSGGRASGPLAEQVIYALQAEGYL